MREAISTRIGLDAGKCGERRRRARWRSHAAKMLGAFLLLAAHGRAQQPAAWDKTVSVEIIAPDHKPDGKTWDLDIPVMIGAAMPNLGDPAPDMMLCVVDGTGGDNCVHEQTVNHFGVPFSICPNAYKCTFGNLKVPSRGYFGFLVIDLDELPSKQDYMLAAILRNEGPADPQQAWKIEKNLKALIARWHAVGAPDEFPESPVGDCTPKDPCFGSSKGGVPSISISTPEVRVCGMPIQGTLEFGPGDDAGSVDFQFRATQNECPGTMEYVWKFGDGQTATSPTPRVSHHYTQRGSYLAAVIPRCVRKSSMCDAGAITANVSLGN